MNMDYEGPFAVKIMQQLNKIERDHDTPLVIKIKENIQILDRMLGTAHDSRGITKISNAFKRHFFNGDVAFLNLLKSHNCALSFYIENLFQVHPIDPDGKYNLKMHQELKILLNNLVKKDILKELISEVEETNITPEELEAIVITNSYVWVANQQDKDALYSIFDYKYVTYYVKRLHKYNQEQANFLNGYDTLKSVIAKLALQGTKKACKKVINNSN